MRASDCAQIAANPGWLLRFVPDLEGSCLRALSNDRRALNADVTEPAAEGDVRRAAAGRAGAVLGLSTTAAALPRKSRLRAALPVVLLPDECIRAAARSGHRGARRRRGKRSASSSTSRSMCGASSTCSWLLAACIARASSRQCSDSRRWRCRTSVFYALGVSVAGMYALHDARRTAGPRDRHSPTSYSRRATGTK